MKKWDYYYLGYDNFDIDSDIDLERQMTDLDEAGLKGFELVSVITKGSSILHLFKRPIEVKKPPKLNSPVGEQVLRKFSVGD